LNDRPRRATAEAVTDVRLFRLSADSFHWLRKLKPSFERGLERHDVLTHLRTLDIFAELTDEELKKLAGYVGLAHYRPRDVLYRQGEIDPTLYILYEGEAIIRVRDAEGRERPIGYLQPKDAVGEASLFLKEPRDVTVESTTDSNWFYLTRQDLDLFLDHYPRLADKMIPREEVERRWRWTRPPWMEPDEQLVWLGRRHSFYLSSRLSLPLLLLLIALVLLILPGLPNLLGYAILVLAVFWAGWSFVDWYNDYYAITTARAVHREKVVLIRETRDETPLNKIQNINIRQGLVGNTFGFGTLLIDTAAAAGASRVTFDYLGEPRQVQELLFGQIRRARAGERLEMQRVIRDKLEESVGPSIRPDVPKPAVGAPSSPSAPPPQSGPPAVGQIYEATLGRYFWIEKRADRQIIWRKHWIRLLQRIWLPALVTLGLLLVLIAASFALGAGSLWLDVFLVGLLMLSLGWLWWSWEDWGNDLYIVTDDRIIDTEARPLGFGSTRTETTFDRIQNVSFDIPGPVATFFDYGTVIIYTAGAQGRLDFDWVQAPKRVQREIFRRLTAYEERQRQRDQEDRWADLPQWFAVYERNYRS
jgi:CRP-like cAMP-binding protein/membrane protein YdbS with pleckstrin-like domain